MELEKGRGYKWSHQPEQLVYIGPKRYDGDMRVWHQFAKVEQPDIVWCEVLRSELYMMEETEAANAEVTGRAASGREGPR